jgi:hypothetical protein
MGTGVGIRAEICKLSLSKVAGLWVLHLLTKYVSQITGTEEKQEYRGSFEE